MSWLTGLGDFFSEIPNTLDEGWRSYREGGGFLGLQGSKPKPGGGGAGTGPLFPSLSGSQGAGASLGPLSAYLGNIQQVGTTPGIPAEFQKYLTGGTMAQTAPIEALYQAGIAELNRRQGESEALLKAFPGQINQTTKQQQGALTDVAKTLGAQVGNFSPVSLAQIGQPATLGIEPAMGAMQAINLSHLQDVPYLNVANRQFLGAQHTALDVAQQEAKSEIQKQQQQNMVQLALAAMQQQGRAQMFNAEQHNRGLSDYYQYQSALDKAGMKDQTQNGQLAQVGTYNSAERGLALIQSDPDHANMLNQKFPVSWKTADRLVKVMGSGDKAAAQKANQQLVAWINEGNPQEQVYRSQIASILMFWNGGLKSK